MSLKDHLNQYLQRGFDHGVPLNKAVDPLKNLPQDGPCMPTQVLKIALNSQWMSHRGFTNNTVNKVLQSDYHAKSHTRHDAALRLSVLQRVEHKNH